MDDEFMALADERIGAIEQMADIARKDLTAELTSAAKEGRGTKAELRDVRAAGAELESNLDRILAITGEMRATLARLAGDEPHGSPSAGVRLMVNQMALLGRSEASISRALADLGVEDPDALVHELLDGPPPDS